MTAVENCPDPRVHGNPFRYCPYCDWVEAPADPGRSGGEGTGWHRHQTQGIVRDVDCRCTHGVRNVPAPILLDPAGARDTIARALDRAEDEWDDLIEHGYAYSQGRTREDFFAEQILAALVREAGR